MSFVSVLLLLYEYYMVPKYILRSRAKCKWQTKMHELNYIIPNYILIKWQENKYACNDFCLKGYINYSAYDEH